MANAKRDGAKERFWRGVLARAAASGLSVRAFCRRERLGEPSFYAWRRIIAERDRERSRPEAGRRTLGGPSFLPVCVTDGATPAGLAPPGSIAIELAGGRVLRLPESTPPERIAALVHALEGRAAR